MEENEKNWEKLKIERENKQQENTRRKNKRKEITRGERKRNKEIAETKSKLWKLKAKEKK